MAVSTIDLQRTLESPRIAYCSFVWYRLEKTKFSSNLLSANRLFQLEIAQIEPDLRIAVVKHGCSLWLALG